MIRRKLRKNIKTKVNTFYPVKRKLNYFFKYLYDEAIILLVDQLSFKNFYWVDPAVFRLSKEELLQEFQNFLKAMNKKNYKTLNKENIYKFIVNFLTNLQSGRSYEDSTYSEDVCQIEVDHFDMWLFGHFKGWIYRLYEFPSIDKHNIPGIMRHKYRDMLEYSRNGRTFINGSFNKDELMTLHDISEEEIEKLIEDCNGYFIKTMVSIELPRRD